MWIGKRSSHYIGIKRETTDHDPFNTGSQPGVSVVGSSSPWTVTVITEKPHLRLPGENVALNGITKDAEPVPVLSTVLNRLFRISEVHNPTKFSFLIGADPGNPSSEQTTGTGQFLGKHFVGLSPDGGSGSVAEGNRVHGARSSVYHDTWASRDTVLRRNHFRDTIEGIRHSNGNFSESHGITPTLEAVEEPSQESATVARLRTVEVHGWPAGHHVVIDGVVDSLDQPIAAYNGIFPILSVPDPKSFTYATHLSGAATPKPGVKARWGGVWEQGLLVIEGNIIELVHSLMKSGYGPPLGILLEGIGDLNPPRHFRRLLIRHNVIGSVGHQLDPSKQTRGIFAQTCENLIVNGNIIHLDTDFHIRHRQVGSVSYFGNQDPAGELLQGIIQPFGQPAAGKVNELTTDAALAGVLAT